jgi:hypothetical protein
MSDEAFTKGEHEKNLGIEKATRLMEVARRSHRWPHYIRALRIT